MVLAYFQPRTVAICLVLLLYVAFIDYKTVGQFNFHSGIFSPKKSISEVKEILDFKSSMASVVDSLPYEGDPEYPFNNVLNSLFPIDAMFEFNTTYEGNITTHKFLGRYASFSRVLSDKVIGRYKILSENACTKISINKEDQNKILVVSRGDCNFVTKVLNIIESNAKPKAIIIANNEPYRGLVTMYSNTFNQDGALSTPIVFITYEDGKLLQSQEDDNTLLQISTASIGNWFNIVLSIVLSPPLLIILVYCLIICGQRVRRRQISKRNTELVKNLPVYVYNDDQLILEPDFDKNIGLIEPGVTDPSLFAKTASKRLRILTSPNDYFRAFKCSICLEKYEPLHSRVMVLECKHMYHQKCLSRWLINFRRSCPLCNSTIFKDNLLTGHEVTYGSVDMETGVTEGSSREAEVQRPFNYRIMSSQGLFQRPLLISRPLAILNCYHTDSDGPQLSTSIDSV